VNECGVHVAGVGRVPLVDLLAGESDRVLFRGDQRGSGRRAGGLNPAAADHSKAAIQSFTEQCVLRVREGRSEHHRGRRSRGDSASAEGLGSVLGELRISESRFGGKDAQVEPLEELAAAVRIAGVGLREMNVGIDESGQQETRSMIVNFAAREVSGERFEFSAVGRSFRHRRSPRRRRGSRRATAPHPQPSDDRKCGRHGLDEGASLTEQSTKLPGAARRMLSYLSDIGIKQELHAKQEPQPVHLHHSTTNAEQSAQSGCRCDDEAR
jgi:hypothetical protein